MPKIVIIGNGVVKEHLGEKIDKCDTVVRFKKFVTKGYEKNIGTKTDVIGWNLGHLMRENIDYCKRILGGQHGTILVHKPYYKHGKEKGTPEGKRAYAIKKYKKEYGSDFKFVPSKETKKIYDRYSSYFGDYKKYHISTGLYFILYFLLHEKYDTVHIAGFDFFETGHQYNQSHKHSHSHSSKIEKKIIHKLISQGRVKYLQ